MKKRVVFWVNQLIIGGVETILANTLPLLKDKYHITIISKTDEIIDEYWEFYKNLGIEIVVLPEYVEKKRPSLKLKRFFKIISFYIYTTCRDLIYKYKLKNIFKKYNFDIVIDYHSCSQTKFIKCCGSNVRKIGYWHGSGYLFSNYYSKEDIIFKFKQYNKIVFITNRTINSICDFIDIHKKFIHLSTYLDYVYNFFDQSKVLQLSKQKVADLPSEPFFTCVARLGSDKDHLTIIQAVNLAKETIPNLKILFIGEGSEQNKIVDLINQLGLKDNIILLGSLANPYPYMQKAIANILSSTSEGLPTVLLEAMALKTLAISSDCPDGPQEILLNGDAGLLFEVGDYAKLAQLMVEVYKNPDQFTAMKELAFNSLERFNQKNTISKLIEIIEN